MFDNINILYYALGLINIYMNINISFVYLLLYTCYSIILTHCFINAKILDLNNVNRTTILFLCIIMKQFFNIHLFILFICFLIINIIHLIYRHKIYITNFLYINITLIIINKLINENIISLNNNIAIISTIIMMYIISKFLINN